MHSKKLLVQSRIIDLTCLDDPATDVISVFIVSLYFSGQHNFDINPRRKASSALSFCPVKSNSDAYKYWKE